MKIIILCMMVFLVSSAILTDPEKQFAEQIEKILTSHLVNGTKWGYDYYFYRPALEKYGPYQWLWDSAFHMISWSRINPQNSIKDLRTMFQKQNKKTFQIPEMIFWGQEGFKDKIINRLLNSDPTITDITQMPMLAFSLRRIYEEVKDKAILEEFLDKMIEYYEWWARFRQPDYDGQIVIIHPWESGLDASPAYDQALKVENPKPALMELYPKFQELIVSYKYLYRWKQRHIVKKKKYEAHKGWLSYFVVKDVGVNAIYTASWKILADFAAEMGKETQYEYCIRQYRHFVQGIEKLYDEEKGRYVTKYLHKNEYKAARADTVQSLLPILIPQIAQNHRKSILAALNDPLRYKSQYPIPTVSQSDPAFNPVFTIDLMWRGPSWAAPNYFVLQGLRALNQTQLYKDIGEKWLKNAMKNGIWEMWNPLQGTGYGVKDLGMSTSVLDVMYRLKQL